jgi:hypothetical protein
MNKVTLEDIKDIAEYEKIRPHFRQYIIQLKKHRRVQVGDLVTFVFENRETVIYQIQEMMRAERMVDEERIQEEIDVYNELVPGDQELSATMFIEIDDPAVLRQWLPNLIGIEQAVYLNIGQAHEIPGAFEPGRSKEDKTSTVHYIKFPLTPDQVRAFGDEAQAIHLVVDHPHYRASTVIDDRVRDSLIRDLSETGTE